MNKIVTVQSKKIREETRFEPKFFVFIETLAKAKEKYVFVPLSDFTEKIARGQSPKPSTYKDKWNGKHNFIRTVDVKKQQIATETTVYLDDKTYSEMKSNRIESGDILISVVGNYLGSASVVPSNVIHGTFNDNSARIRIKDKTHSPFFYTSFFNSKFGQQLIHSKATRTGQKILSAGNLKKIEVPLDQDSYVIQNLEKASTLEDKANVLIFEAQQECYEYIKPILANVKREKIYSVNKSFFANVDLWTPMYSFPLYVDTNSCLKNSFGTVKIGEIADLLKGDEVGSDNYVSYIDRQSDYVGFIRTSDVVNYDLDIYPDFYVPSEIYSDLNQDFKKGDVLFTKDGKIGVVAMFTDSDKSIVGSGFIGLRFKTDAIKYNLTPEYLFTMLSIKEIGIYEARRRSVYASTIPHLREDRIKEMEIPLLPTECIETITQKVKDAFELKSKKKKLIIEAMRRMDELYDLI